MPLVEEAEDPACVPIFWISKWVDYSDKYGLGKASSVLDILVLIYLSLELRSHTVCTGYQLCDNSVGVLFNDSTRLIMYDDGDRLQYIDRNSEESYLRVRSYPSMLTKKVSHEVL